VTWAADEGGVFMVAGLAQRLAAFCLAVAAVAGVRGADFSVTSVAGVVEAGKAGHELAAVKAGDTFGPGALVRTGKDGRLGGQIGARNAFVLQPETTVRVRDPEGLRTSGLCLVLEQGRVESGLEAWPAGAVYQVRSAAGTFAAQGTAFAVGYRRGPEGQFIGGTEVTRGEVGFEAPECSVPSLTANGGLSISRTLGLESVLLEVTANGNALTLILGGRHRISVPAGSTVRIGMALRYTEVFAAVWVSNGSIQVGGQTITPADRALFISESAVLPNGGGIAFMEAVRVESGAHAQAQLPGLTAEQLAALQASQRSGARAVLDSAVGAGVLPMYQPPFVPERPISAPLSASGTP